MKLEQLEYQYRKTQRGLRLLIRYLKIAHQMQQPHLRVRLQEKALYLASLKKELHRRTGSTQPSLTEWPL